MILVGAHQITKSFSDRPLFKNLTFSIEAGERVGLIGPNGAGKSTLMKILASQTNVDGGRLSLNKGLRVGFLEQVPQFQEDATIQSTLMEGASDAYEWTEIARAQELSSRLSLKQFSDDMSVAKLSGGWKKRVALARELMKNPDLLLLDEPTNHLDVESILWLESFLDESPFATLTITHDRVFLQKIANRIIEIDRRHPDGLISLTGTYADFLELRSSLIKTQESQEQKLRNTLERETEWLRRGAQARQTKQQARIDATHRLSETVAEISARNASRTVRLDFQAAERNPKKLIEAKNISKSYNGQIVVPPMNLLIGPKSRIGLMGVNGCGKSTLIKMITKEIEPDSGTVFHAENIQVAYFEQNRETLNPNINVFRTLCPSGDHVEFQGNMVHVRGYLARFLFNSEQMETPVSRLSGGEQSRLLLAKLMLTKANILVLDEPTNDLDISTLDVLTDVLMEFSGAILVVTHDRYFLDQLTNKILAFGHDDKGNKIIDTMVGLDQWNDWHREQQEILKTRLSQETVNPRNLPSPKNTGKKNAQKVLQIEAEIAGAEKELKRLQDDIAQNANLDSKRLIALTSEMAKIQLRIDELYEKLN